MPALIITSLEESVISFVWAFSVYLSFSNGLGSKSESSTPFELVLSSEMLNDGSFSPWEVKIIDVWGFFAFEDCFSGIIPIGLG